MKRMLIAIVMLALVSVATFCQVPATQKAPRPGILLLAHGGALERNEEVRHVADRVDLSIPT